MIRTLIVDDEPLSRRRIRDLLDAEEDFVVIGECGDGEAAMTALRERPCDLVFLDVQMPGMDGLEIARRLVSGSGPAVIFVTAYDCYALPAFEVHAVDYLLKPFDRLRFRKALSWARIAIRRDRGETSPSLPNELQAERKPLERVTIKTGGRVLLLKTTDIDWVEAAGNYLRLHVGTETHLLRETMNNWRPASIPNFSGVSTVPRSSTSIASANSSRSFMAITSLSCAMGPNSISAAPIAGISQAFSVYLSDTHPG